MTYKVVIRGYVQTTHDHFMRHLQLKDKGSYPASIEFKPCDPVVMFLWRGMHVGELLVDSS